jgi:sulfur relay (sulfurtransferase) complex TusBCD TusD component (DsrE family)
MRKFGILLALPPSHGSVATVHGLAEAALRRGHEVYLYLIDEGVRNVSDARYVALAHAGARLFVCAYGCQQHAVATDKIDSKVSLCGLVVLSGIIDSCDPFLAFT